MTRQELTKLSLTFWDLYVKEVNSTKRRHYGIIYNALEDMTEALENES